MTTTTTNSIQIVDGISRTDCQCLMISGVWFNVHRTVDYVPAKTKSGIRRVNTYTVFVSPDYNACANRKFEANTIKNLVKRLAKLDYRIVKPTTRY